MSLTEKQWRYIKIFMNMVIVFVLLFFMYTNFRVEQELCERGTHIVTLGEDFIVRNLESREEQERGLSGNVGLWRDEGVLFVFDAPTEIGFWMKEMLFSIDIIFLDGENKVIGLVEDAHPDSYPKLFVSPKDTRAVLEVSAGSINRVGITKGQSAEVTPCGQD